MSFTFVLIGTLTVVYAATKASNGANSNAEVIQTFDPVVELALNTTPWALLLIVAISLIGAIGWMLKLGRGSTRGVRR